MASRETQNAISLFALSLGQIMGSLMREDIKAFITSKGILDEMDIADLLAELKQFASQFYEETEEEVTARLGPDPFAESPLAGVLERRGG